MIFFTSCLCLSLRTWVPKCFWNFLDMFMCISCHKNYSWVGFLQNFQFFQFSNFFLTGLMDWSWSLIDKKCLDFRPKISSWFDCCSIDWNFPKISFDRCLNPLDHLKLENFKFLSLWQISFVLFYHFSSTPLDPS